MGRAMGRGGIAEVGNEKQILIHFVSCNIWNGCNGGLELVLQGMAHSNLYLRVIQKIKFIYAVYTYRLSGYSTVATYASR